VRQTQQNKTEQEKKHILQNGAEVIFTTALRQEESGLIFYLSCGLFYGAVSHTI
jgi:hypothetical protein